MIPYIKVRDRWLFFRLVFRCVNLVVRTEEGRICTDLWVGAGIVARAVI